MPYAMLSGVLPKDKVGIYMGIFNFFIVSTRNYCSLRLSVADETCIEQQYAGSRSESGGGLMILAALVCFFFIKETKVDETETIKLEIEQERSI